jgi:hypothetical protein
LLPASIKDSDALGEPAAAPVEAPEVSVNDRAIVRAKGQPVWPRRFMFAVGATSSLRGLLQTAGAQVLGQPKECGRISSGTLPCVDEVTWTTGDPGTQQERGRRVAKPMPFRHKNPDKRLPDKNAAAAVL